jgi:hypothetical protein
MLRGFHSQSMTSTVYSMLNRLVMFTRLGILEPLGDCENLEISHMSKVTQTTESATAKARKAVNLLMPKIW